MNRKVIFAAVGIIAVLAFVFLKPSGKKSAAPVSQKEETAAVPTGELSIFGSLDDVKARQGTPLVVRFAGKDQNLNKIQIAVADSAEKAQSWPFERTKKSETKEIFWTLSVDQFSKIVPGLYKLKTNVSNQVSLEVLPPAATLTPGQQQTAKGREVEFLQAQGKTKEAAQKINEWVEKAPSSEAYARQAQVLEAGGDKSKALESYNNAIREFVKEHPKTQEPPVELFREQGRLFRELMAETAKNPVTIDKSKLKKWPDDFPEFANQKKPIK